MATFLTDSGEFTAEATDGLWLSANDANRVTGWTLKPEGMCRDDVCVPLPPSAAIAGRVDLAAFWRILGAPAVGDVKGEVWSLGSAAEEHNLALAGLVAPDFTLPDLAGNLHTLSTLRGKKVFLSTWASW